MHCTKGRVPQPGGVTPGTGRVLREGPVGEREDASGVLTIHASTIYDCALQQLVSELELGVPLRKPATAKRRPEPGVGRSGGPWRRSTTLQSAIQNSSHPRLLRIRGLDAADSGIDTRGPGEDLVKETVTWGRLFAEFLFKCALLLGLLS